MIYRIQAFQIAGLVFAIFGFILGFLALLTPSWQTVYAREIQQWIQSGLWLSCQIRPNGMHTCAYSFSEHDYDFYTSADFLQLRTPPFYSWQRNLLVVFLIAQFIAFFSFTAFCCAFHIFTERLSPILFTGCIGVSFLMHIGASLTFFTFSQMVEYRFYHVSESPDRCGGGGEKVISVSGIYEKHVGYSYYMELLAAGFYLISLVLSIFHLLRIHMNKPSSSSYGTPIAQNEFYGSGGSYDSRQLDPYETQIAMKKLPSLPSDYYH